MLTRLRQAASRSRIERAPSPAHLRARYDFPTFCEVVMKDSETGVRWALLDFHREWAALSEKLIEPPTEAEQVRDPTLAAWRKRWRAAPWRHNRLVILAPIGHGKSEQRSIALPLWLIGIDPSLRIAIISSKLDMAAKFLNAVKQYVAADADYHRVFPWVRPASAEQGGYWRESAIVVERFREDGKPHISKDPSIQAIGAGEAFQGSRLDVILADDIQNQKTTQTPYQRAKMVEWFASAVSSRAEENSQVSLVATSWHLEDLAHTLVKERGYHGVWYSVEPEDEGRPVIVDGRTIGVRRLAAWPARWTPARLAQQRVEMQLEYDRALRNLAVSESQQIFTDTGIGLVTQLGRAEALRYWSWVFDRGQLHGPAYTGGLSPRIVGVDLATRKGEENDLTCFFCIALDEQGRRRVASIIALRIEGPDILRVLLGVQRLFQPDVFMVENNAAQVYIEQLAQDPAVMRALGATQADLAGLNVAGYTTGKQKADLDLGIRSLAVEFAVGKWLAPAHPDVDRWLSEARSFDPSAHTGDRLMAAWLAKEGARLFFSRKRKPARVYASGLY